MDFSLSPEQAMLRDSVERFAAEHGDFPAWRRRVAAGEAFDASAWAQMAQLGWLGIAVPEAAGGMGFGPVETMLVAEGLGRSLCRVPYAGSCVLAPALLAESDPLLGDIVAGTVQVAAAVSEAEGRYDLAHVATSAVRAGTMNQSAVAPSGTKLLAPSSTQPPPDRTALVATCARS